MLELRDILVSYHKVPALHGVSLHLDEGEVVAVVGGNGNGKSTTLRAIAGLNPIDSGTILYKGERLDTVPAHQRVRRGIVLVPEGRRLFPRLSVEQNLMLGAFTVTDSRKTEETLAFVLDTFPILAERRRQTAGTLSGGEQQMLAMGRGLMSQPELLMLDEPSWGVAPKLVTRILDTIQLISSKGISILLVEQNVHRALEIADRGYVIQTGRIVMEGAGKDLIGDEKIKRAYLGL
ncbi:ABC transporter ATP-binding protein [Telmatospirillum sp.]|uniref:ABC transporter ATP-binding protein n=1 Tax=Telmatospirillum sp. TaxID=2079197 RepID=UPI00283B758A|nr:ABC transporter ATP-binding protein [Telmatospirillum sp.]MDR3438014.1 ABC transporter ATP-binding protein [Telmatospirillum sp.]